MEAVLGIKWLHFLGGFDGASKYVSSPSLRSVL